MMKLRALRLYNVRCFDGRGSAIEAIADGVNLLCAANETGKSTSFDALHALFFHPHSATRKEIKQLRPYSGANPLIEVDIETKDKFVRITKQYLGKCFARVQDIQTQKLLAQADEAENFITQLLQASTNDQAGTPTGLLWVRQGANIAENTKENQATREQQARIGLLQSVQGEIDCVTGGRRMDVILTRLYQELGQMVTKRGPKVGSSYARAHDECEYWQIEEKRLAIEVSALRQALENRAKALKRLAECEDPQAQIQRQQEIIAAQANFDGAKLQKEKLASAQIALQLAQQNHEIHQHNFEQFHQALAKETQLRPQYHACLDRRDRLVTNRQILAEKLNSARQEGEACETRLHQLREQLNHLEQAQYLASLKQQFTQASLVATELTEIETQRHAIKITPIQLDELHELDIEIASLSAQKSASHPSIHIAYHANADKGVLLDGKKLEDGEKHFYAGLAQLEIPQIATLTLQANLPYKQTDTLESAQIRKQSLLDELGLENLAKARLEITQAQKLDITLAGLRAQLAQLAPQGLSTCQAEYQAALQRAKKLTEDDDATNRETLLSPQDAKQRRLALNQEIEDVAQNQQAARLAVQRLEAERLIDEQAFIACEGQLAAFTADLAHLEIIIGSPENQQMRQELAQKLSKKLATHHTHWQMAQQTCQNLQATMIDFDLATAHLQRVCSADESVRQEIAQLRETLAGLNAAINTHSEKAVEEKWHEACQNLEAAQARLATQIQEVAILTKLTTTLEAARANARDLYLTPVMRELTPLLHLLFDDVAIHLDEKTLLPRHLTRSNTQEAIEHLSGGMREQLSILTRLAFARLLAHDGREIPIILDDALVYCDDERIEKMFDALHRQSQSQQIIVFSCRQRAFQKLGGNILQMRDWHPTH